MGLAASQVRLLGLTARKADCELEISLNSMRKMALTREMTELSREYNARLQSKQVSYYANGQYNKVNYQYLMGGSDWLSTLNGLRPYKKDNSMVLTDYRGRVVLSDTYANAIKSVLGNDIMNSSGQGGTFSKDKIPEILEKLLCGANTQYLNANSIRTVMNGGSIDSSYTATIIKTLRDQTTGETTKVGSTDVDSTAKATEYVKSIIDLYTPIFQAAANNGWTTEYNCAMESNDDYISDAIISGTFNLETVDDFGDYDEGTSLTYFLTNGTLENNTSSEKREDITAWYNAEKARISEKEDWIDLEQADLSTELEAIKTEMESLKSLIDNAISTVFDWGNA